MYIRLYVFVYGKNNSNFGHIHNKQISDKDHNNHNFSLGSTVIISFFSAAGDKLVQIMYVSYY